MRCRFLVASAVLLAAVAAARSQAEELPKKISVDLGGNVKMQFVLIPAGEFTMGSRESPEAVAKVFKEYFVDTEAQWFENEHPMHHVRITKPFYLGACEVTVGQFRQFVGDTGYKTEPEKDGEGSYGYNKTTVRFERKPEYTWRNTGFAQTGDHPVVNVTWNDAVAFCGWLSRKAGGSYRLPTEAEWEYACRAGSATRYYNGDDPERLVEVGNVADSTLKEKLVAHSTLREKRPGTLPWAISGHDGYAFTAPVGRFRPNAFGLYDMHGNVWEWCADWYGKEYYAASPVNDPVGPDSGNGHVARGGAWGYFPRITRSAGRLSFSLGGLFGNTGLRVSRTP